ncbi:tyrosine-type recombinase/integrase [Lentzea sp. NPDC055074]
MSTNTKTVQAAQLLLTRLGLSPEDLLREPAQVPTFAEYIPKVALAAGPGARRTYSTYWAQIIAALGDRRLDQCDATDVEILMRQSMHTRIVRRTDRGGHSTGEHLLAAMRTIYTHAIRDELLPLQGNPAAAIPKPSRQRSLRRALTNPELAAINDIAATTGNDTPLDTLILRLHTETACRRGGALALREDDVDPHWCLLRLREKNNTIRWQPASPTLITALLHHRDQRGTGRPSPGQLLRYHDGTPITSRRYDGLWRRIGDHLPWAAVQGVSTHWLRHTTLTWVERHFGHAVARAYAGHNDHPDDSTSIYTRAQLPELATALATLTGEPHPLTLE